jgi:uncharacterized protein
VSVHKPLPPMDAQSRWWWQACHDGQLLLQQCELCGHLQHYPRLLCLECGTDRLTHTKASGLGTVSSFTIIRRAVSAAFEADVPYVVALIELAEGPTIMANIVNSPVDAVTIGAPVRVTFERRTEEVSIPQFELAERLLE